MNAHFPAPVNSAAPDRVTGGSSSGSAAAVAGKLVRHRRRLRHRRLDPRAGKLLRADRPAHHAWPHLARRRDAARAVARHVRLVRRRHRDLRGGRPHPARSPIAHRGILTRPVTHGPARRAGDRPRGGRRLRPVAAKSSIQATREETFESPFQSTMDELYWCLRRLQAYEAWQIHGAWIKAKPRRLGPGIKERFEFGATVDRNTAHAEEVRRIAFRAELAGDARQGRLSGAADGAGRRAAEERAAPGDAGLSRAGAAGCCACPACPAFRRSRCRSARCTARRSASRCSGRPTATSR